jgi:hypothetical protein
MWHTQAGKDVVTAAMTGATLRMSREAIGWVLRDAPGVPAQCVSVLIGLAEHADKAGRSAYPSAATLSAYARKSERQVRYDLSLLTEAKLIRPGDQSRTADLPVNRRPVVYDLAMERTQALEVQPTAPQGGVQSTSGVQPTAPLQPTAPQTADDLQEPNGVQPTAPQDALDLGCNTAQPGVQPTADKPRTKPKSKPTGATAPAKHEVADALAAAFWEHHQSRTAQSFISIRQVIRTAIANQLPRDDVARALDKLARESRPISGGTITTALQQIRNPGSSNGRVTAAPLPPTVSPRDEHRYRR